VEVRVEELPVLEQADAQVVRLLQGAALDPLQARPSLDVGGLTMQQIPNSDLAVLLLVAFGAGFVLGLAVMGAFN